ncbi:hypothetical protein LJC16_01655 [Bacteroidales bacterium OttesenSCG-928-C19]|nr:hypothetical protein [Bacteroidales bacterium OttesenSCG-928-C19]
MKKGILGIILSIFAVCVYAQMPPTEVDALRFSQASGLYGTASSVGKGGAIGALGGDLSSAISNPAGLGVFSRSEISYSPMWQWNSTTAKYGRTEDIHDDHSGRFGTFSSVFTFKNNNESSGFKAIQFGLGTNRINHFNNQINISGKSNVSMAEEWAYQANGTDYDRLDVFSTDLAFWTYVIDTIPGSINQYRPTLSGDVRQRKIIEEEGGVWDYNFSFAANYQDFLYMGATVGIPTLEYKRVSRYKEREVNGNNEFTYKETNEVEGTGVNLKLGVIVRALDWLRIGAAYHTPTHYSVEDSYYVNMVSNIDGQEYIARSTDYGNDGPSPTLEYTYRTPGKFLGSLAFVLGNQHTKIAGTLSADYEYTNYSNIRYSSDENLHTTVNKWIKDYLKESHTVRVGGQMNFGKNAVRLGYVFSSSPYKIEEYESAKHSITGGLGYKSKWYYIDLAYAYTLKDSRTYITEVWVPENEVKLRENKHNLILTFGLRF